MAQTIIVGNGKITGKGVFIDAYNTVIRINHLDKPFCATDRGLKIDIWALIGRKKDIARTRKQFPSIREVWVFSGIHANQDRKWSTFQRAKIGAEPTTGFFTIARALDKFKKVDIIGFDFFEGEELHYWKDDRIREKVISGHKPDFEKVIVGKWIEEGKIRIF